MSNAFDEIAEGLQDAIAHAGGDASAARISVVNPLPVAAIRAKLGLSQVDFALAFGVSVATVRNWEQGRRAPRGPARALLMVIDKEPGAVRRALQAA